MSSVFHWLILPYMHLQRLKIFLSSCNASHNFLLLIIIFFLFSLLLLLIMNSYFFFGLICVTLFAIALKLVYLKINHSFCEISFRVIVTPNYKIYFCNLYLTLLLCLISCLQLMFLVSCIFSLCLHLKHQLLQISSSYSIDYLFVILFNFSQISFT